MSNNLPLELTINTTSKIRFSSGFFLASKSLDSGNYGSKNHYVVLTTNNFSDYYKLGNELTGLKGIANKKYLLAYKDETDNTILSLDMEDAMVTLIKTQSNSLNDELVIIIKFLDVKISQNVGGGSLSVSMTSGDKGK